MANEAVIIELLGFGGNPVRYTCANANALAKGTLLKITTPRTAAATANDNDPFAGVCATEKVALDGQTTIAAYTKGIFDILTGAAVTAGEKVSISGANAVTIVAANDQLFADVGTALETIGGAGTIAIFVGYGW